MHRYFSPSVLLILILHSMVDPSHKVGLQGVSVGVVAVPVPVPPPWHPLLQLPPLPPPSHRPHPLSSPVRVSNLWSGNLETLAGEAVAEPEPAEAVAPRHRNVDVRDVDRSRMTVGLGLGLGVGLGAVPVPIPGLGLSPLLLAGAALPCPPPLPPPLPLPALPKSPPDWDKDRSVLKGPATSATASVPPELKKAMDDNIRRYWELKHSLQSKTWPSPSWPQNPSSSSSPGHSGVGSVTPVGRPPCSSCMFPPPSATDSLGPGPGSDDPVVLSTLPGGGADVSPGTGTGTNWGTATSGGSVRGITGTGVIGPGDALPLSPEGPPIHAPGGIFDRFPGSDQQGPLDGVPEDSVTAAPRDIPGVFPVSTATGGAGATRPGGSRGPGGSTHVAPGDTTFQIDVRTDSGEPGGNATRQSPPVEGVGIELPDNQTVTVPRESPEFTVGRPSDSPEVTPVGSSVGSPDKSPVGLPSSGSPVGSTGGEGTTNATQVDATIPVEGQNSRPSDSESTPTLEQASGPAAAAAAAPAASPAPATGPLQTQPSADLAPVLSGAPGTGSGATIDANSGTAAASTGPSTASASPAAPATASSSSSASANSSVNMNDMIEQGVISTVVTTAATVT